jgi:hypothetical protein
VIPPELYIYSEPVLALLKEPEIFFNPSIFNGKYSYRQVINGLKKDLNRPKLDKELWDELCKNTAFACLSIIPKITKNKNSQQLLEFKYILEKDTCFPWLIKIDSDLTFHPNAQEGEEGTSLKTNEEEKDTLLHSSSYSNTRD